MEDREQIARERDAWLGIDEFRAVIHTIESAGHHVVLERATAIDGEGWGRDYWEALDAALHDITAPTRPDERG